MLKVSLYGYGLGMTSSRRLQQRIRIMEGQCVRGPKKQAHQGPEAKREPSPAGLGVRGNPNIPGAPEARVYPIHPSTYLGS